MSADNDKVEKRIKIFTLVSLLAACLGFVSGLIPLALTALLKVQFSEGDGFAMAFFVMVPLFLIASVLGFFAFFYGMKNPLWRGGRIAVLVMSIGLLTLYSPLLFQAVIGLLPFSKG